jgi:hypothetical protein
MNSHTRLRHFITSELFAIVAALLTAAPATAQTFDWTSTDVGAVTTAGSASQINGVWTVSGDGSDIWGTADSFQFVHRSMLQLTPAGVLTVRINDMQNTHQFAQAGLMFRSSTNADAAAFLLSVKPNGDVELLERQSNGASMQYLGGATVSFPAWLRLEHTLNGGTNAWMSQDGWRWTLLREEVPVQLGQTFEAGVAVTSHDAGQLNTAHFDHLNLDFLHPGWVSADIGDVGLAGRDQDDFGKWTVTGAGNDIWGTADSFHFAYLNTTAKSQHIVVRVDDLFNTHEFAKAGVMLRASADAGAPTAILDMKPDGATEFMVRGIWGGDMLYLGGISGPPAQRWLDLSWEESDPGFVLIKARTSGDKVHWNDVGPPIAFQWAYLMEAGLAVTSHNLSQATTAHFEGLELLSLGAWSDDIGSDAAIGSAFNVLSVCCGRLVVEAGGADIWGTADSFEFVHGSPDTAGIFHAISTRVATFAAGQPFAKAGLMFRDSLDPNAAQVIVDVKPGGGVEFMARLCTGCETTYLGGVELALPVWLTLFRDGSRFEAVASSDDLRTRTNLGTVVVPMAAPYVGYALTGHGPKAVAVFDDPPR